MPARLRFYTAPATLVSIAVILALAVVAGVMAFSGSPALAVNVSCGDTITTDTTLHKNLVNCPNNGIVIGANGVTLNLNGHTIDGDGKPFEGCGQGELCDSGVVDDGHDGVTVKQGSVREFAFGLNLGPARHARVLGLAAVKNGFTGIACFKCVRSLVRNVAAVKNGVSGIVFFKSARSVVRNSSGSGSTAREGDGLDLFQSHHVRILHNSFRGNVHVGVKPIDSTNSLIKGNVFSRNGDEAILMEGGAGFKVRRNRVVRNGGGVTLGPGSRNVITRNRVSHGRDGIRIEKGHGNLIAHNVVAHTRRAGIRLGIKHPFIGGAHNVVRGNLVRGSGADGFAVVRKARNSLLRNNVAKGAGDDGFDVESHSMKLTGNRAVRNADLGIEAVRGVIDGGGNIARHNGDPRQCTNIACN